MKKSILILFASLIVTNAFAQLKPPTSTVRDTLIVNGCIYNGSSVPFGDWPCVFLEETATEIIVAGEVYKKNKPTMQDYDFYAASWGGHVDHVSYGKATVNGKAAKELYVVKTRKDCEDYPSMKFGVDGYEFYVLPKDVFFEKYGDILMEAAEAAGIR